MACWRWSYSAADCAFRLAKSRSCLERRCESKIQVTVHRQQGGAIQTSDPAWVRPFRNPHQQYQPRWNPAQRPRSYGASTRFGPSWGYHWGPWVARIFSSRRNRFDFWNWPIEPLFFLELDWARWLNQYYCHSFWLGSSRIWPGSVPVHEFWNWDWDYRPQSPRRSQNGVDSSEHLILCIWQRAGDLSADCLLKELYRGQEYCFRYDQNWSVSLTRDLPSRASNHSSHEVHSSDRWRTPTYSSLPGWFKCGD